MQVFVRFHAKLARQKAIVSRETSHNLLRHWWRLWPLHNCLDSHPSFAQKLIEGLVVGCDVNLDGLVPRLIVFDVNIMADFFPAILNKPVYLKCLIESIVICDSNCPFASA
jgi:hypothetical protein